MVNYKSICKTIKNPYKLASYLGERGMLKSIPDEIYLKWIYRARMDKNLDIDNPITFNEKLQWLKLYDRNPLYTQLVDKYEVRKYISNIIGERYLIPLLGVYEKFSDIDFDKLPSQFVLKCTHDSGGLVVCKDKNTLDMESAERKINRSLKRNYYYLQREWPYKDVKPRIICEKYMLDESNEELKDYKFLCFNGKVQCSFVCLNRGKKEGLNVDFYDLNWNPMPFIRQYPNSGQKINKPKNYDQMIEFAELLSKDFPFVRVDFYEVNGNLYFGELTFYPGSGLEKFSPEKYDEIFGDWMKLPKEKLIR
ncbi:ATP-grasp fold amidoligase family protein [Bacillus toyonensis]|uniref:ATP-grasp fold amidoligase family protein n=1 Tax=Bacillus toyonensis TaxID=155322 RepID=UPI000BFBE96D|nr:ATP-grasp fold amidoligase family protein [Bacillus toyonensis]PHF43400.1 glycosyl transferase [Bacillus toyonensis]